MRLTNNFHNSSTTIKPDSAGTVSASTYSRARRELCGHEDCKCFGSRASGSEVLVIANAQRLENGRYRLWSGE